MCCLSLGAWHSSLSMISGTLQLRKIFYCMDSIINILQQLLCICLSPILTIHRAYLICAIQNPHVSVPQEAGQRDSVH